jgi:hypothetical protein
MLYSAINVGVMVRYFSEVSDECYPDVVLGFECVM